MVMLTSLRALYPAPARGAQFSVPMESMLTIVRELWTRLHHLLDLKITSMNFSLDRLLIMPIAMLELLTSMANGIVHGRKHNCTDVRGRKK